MRVLKRTLYKHFNCLPWLIVGIQILADGEITRWQYALCWICTLAMIWRYAPLKFVKGAEENAGRNSNL